MVLFSVFPVLRASGFTLLVKKKKRVPIVTTITLLLLRGISLFYTTLNIQLTIPISLYTPLFFIPKNLNLTFFIALI